MRSNYAGIFPFLLVAALRIGGLTAGTGQETRLLPVSVSRAPAGGIQPQAMLDASGTLHLIYFKGDPAAGDIYYVRRLPGEAFSEPIRVNSQPGSAIAIGTIRGAQMAVGRDGEVYVAWNGSSKAEPRGPGGTPMLFTRLNAGRDSFEPQRNLITWAGGLDGGGSVAADQKGNVYVTWHAGPSGGGEARRAVYVARSSDDGQRFAREVQANPLPTGACGCCGMRAFVDKDGALYILYRAAGHSVDRDMTLLVSYDQGVRFTTKTVDTWRLDACPMSSATMTQSGAGVLAAWETREQVFFAAVRPNGTLSPAIPASGAGPCKHPVVAANQNGETLFAWTEGTGWNRGGALAWQVYGKDGKPTEQRGRMDGVPVWDLPTAFALPDGRFTILY